MAIVSTSDVCQNIDSSREVPKHGSILCHVSQGGSVYTIDTYVSNVPTYSSIETLLTGKFDETGYYVTADTVDGGSA